MFYCSDFLCILHYPFALLRTIWEYVANIMTLVPYTLQNVSPKDILLHNCNTISTSKIINNIFVILPESIMY